MDLDPYLIKICKEFQVVQVLREFLKHKNRTSNFFIEDQLKIYQSFITLQ
jgi:hypothetical protein